MEKKSGFQVPHTYVLICGIIIVMAILTYFVPAGVYDRYIEEESGRELVYPDSYHRVEQTPVMPFDVVRAIPAGMEEVAWITFLIFIIGGAFGIINSTGAVEAGIGQVVLSMKDKGVLIIPIAMLLFSIGGATIGMAESTLLFIPIGITLARGMGYDAVTGMAMVNIGAGVGFAGGAMNAFTVGVAQGIAGLPMFSGMAYRVFGHMILLVIAAAYVVRYAYKVKADPRNSVVYELEQKEEAGSIDVDMKLTGRQKLVLLTMVVGFGFIVYGALSGWSTSGILSSVFLLMGIVAGIVGGKTLNAIAESFVDGAKSVVYGALVVGISRAILVVLQQGQIIDTIIHSSSTILTMFPAFVSAGLMLLLQSLINFLVNSGSGQAATTMPIMAPLADAVGVTRQTAVLAFQFGDGLSNSLYPTSGNLMAGLSIAKIPYEKWLKWVMPLMLMLHAVCLVLVVIAALINYGPF